MMTRILIPALVALCAGLVVATIFSNKPHRKAEYESAIPVTAPALYAAFKANEAAANTEYLNEVVEVKGEIISREKNQDGQPVAVLRGEPGDDVFGGGIMCTMREKDVIIPSGVQVKLKGFCTGFANDVHLSDCILTDK